MLVRDDGPVKFSVLAKWFNAVGDAYNRGEAPWAYIDGRSEAVRVWSAHGDATLIAWAQSYGIKLQRRRS